jgi:Holliday junction resolvase RusA-like endonuclease
MIEFEIIGEPVGKGRPKFSSRGGFARAYTPKKTTDYEKKVKECYLDQIGTKFEGALRVEITAFYPIPKSTSKKNRVKMLRDEIRCTKKPDIDNIAKIILDALNGVAYEDDKQVVSIEVNKMYGEVPKVAVSLLDLC